MPRWIKISLKILAGLIILLLLVWVGAAIYITRNKDAVLKSVLTQLNKNISGNATVDNMHPDLLRGFPGISVSLEKVILQDSLYNTHHHKLLDAERIGVSLNVFSLLTGNTNINKVEIRNASIYLYTDSNGYSNVSMFSKNSNKAQKQENKGTDVEIRNINFKNVRFIVDNQQKFKKFDFQVDEVLGKVKYPLSGFTGNVKLKTFVNSFSFNTKRGSFLKDQLIEGTLSFHYDKSTENIIVEQKKLNIGKYPFLVGAKINADKGSFEIDIDVAPIDFKELSLMLAPNISSKLLRFGISKPIDVKGKITDDGSGKYGDPYINVAIKVKDSQITIPGGNLDNATFTGTFSNQDIVGKGIGDENSSINFLNLTANYYNAPITIEKFTINDLSRPIALGRVKANFPLTKLNESVDTDIFNFKAGNAVVDLYCKADIDNFQFTKPDIQGNIKISGADITYLPRNMRLVNSALVLTFNQTDLNLKNSRFQLGKSTLSVDCSIKNFLNLYYTAPEKILVDLKIGSPQLYLNEFIPFLGPRTKVVKKKKSGNSIKQFTEQFGSVMESAKVNIQLNVNKAIYKKFIATNLTAAISLINNDVQLQKVSVKHAGGGLTLDGNIQQLGKKNAFKVNTQISSVNIKEFFYAFDNFGQKGITDKNLKGFLSATTTINGSVTDAGSIVPHSINGKVGFNLKNAALTNYDPMIKAGKFAFANRDFSNILLPSLNGNLDIQGEKINISPLQISSSVLNMDVAGVYSLGKGTNITIDIPLRNPQKDEALDAKAKQTNRMKGIVLHLRALDSDDGGVKIRWNKDNLKL